MSFSSSERALLSTVNRLLTGTTDAGSRPCSAELAELFRRHHLRPLAHFDGVQDLEVATQQCAVLAALHHRTLEQIGRTFEERDIAWTTIKGAAYAWTLYKAPEMRPMSDLDLLVRDADFESACRALTDCGFTERSVSTRTRHAQTFFRASHEIVDLHRSILQPMRGNAGISRAWERARPEESLPGFWQLEFVDLCWIHIAHMARHEFIVPLIGYVDLQRLLEALSKSERRQLHEELGASHLAYALEIALEVISDLIAGTTTPGRPPRMRLVIPTQEELLASQHRSRPEQIVKKLVLFPRDTVALGMGWALRTVEDWLILGRSK